MEWKELRKQVLKRDNHKCQKCGSRKNLEVHHKNERNNKLNNLVTLCSACHQKIKKKEAIGTMHIPTLKTVLMVEEALKKSKEYPSKRNLWLSLPKKIMYQTFITVLNYLEDSRKIIIKNRKIIWIWNPELVKKYLESELTVK